MVWHLPAKFELDWTFVLGVRDTYLLTHTSSQTSSHFLSDEVHYLISL